MFPVVFYSHFINTFYSAKSCAENYFFSKCVLQYEKVKWACQKFYFGKKKCCNCAKLNQKSSKKCFKDGGMHLIHVMRYFVPLAVFMRIKRTGLRIVCGLG